MSKSRLKTVFGVVVILGMAGLVALAEWWPGGKRVALAAASSGQPAPAVPHPLTLREAWDISEAYGRNWQPQTAIASIQSVDVQGDTVLSGQDGYRRGWMAVLIGQEASLWLRLVDGVVVEETIQPLSPGFSAIVKPDVDSPQAVALAQAVRPNLGPSHDKKGQGFHFALDTLGEKRAEIVVLGAVGQSPARIRLDPWKGTMLSAQIFTYAPSGGILYSTDSGQTWKASNLKGKMVTSLAPGPQGEAWAYAAVAEQEGIAIYQTQDGGETWEWTGRLPQQAGSWPFDLLALPNPSGRPSLFVGTWNGLWTLDPIQVWSQVDGLPQGPVQWSAAIRSQQGHRILVSISAGEDRGLYSSRDLSRWTKVADKVYRLSESFDRQLVLAVSEEEIGRGLLLGLESERVVSLPGHVLNAVGDFRGRGLMLFRSPASGLGVSQGIEHPARWTLSVPVASLAASPDFLTSQTAVAGGFRSGIFRTTDGGKHWAQVLAMPSDILQGSNEIYEVVFLSPTAVIAVNGGMLTWQDF
ncbi:MAG: hypothetical protein ABIN58_01570 [candidate division WOR-3 bacterium]